MNQVYSGQAILAQSILKFCELNFGISKFWDLLSLRDAFVEIFFEADFEIFWHLIWHWHLIG